LASRFKYPAFLLLLVAGVYALSLDNAFIYDDIPLITHRPPSESFFAAFDVFTKPHWHNLPYYRPVAGLSMALQKTWHGNAAPMFHVFNIGLMMVASLLVYALLRLPVFGLKPLMAFLTAALFAVHPAGSSCVYPICSGRETLLPGACILLAVYGWIRGGRTGYAIALVGLVLGLFSKEQSVVIPVLFIAADVLKLTRVKVPAWRRYLPVVALLLGYALIRHRIFADAPHASLDLALLDQPLGPVLTVGYMLQTWFAPFLALRYEPRAFVWPSWPHAFVALVLIAVTARLFFRTRDAWRQMLFFVLFAAAVVAPTANILLQEAHFAERYTWLAWLAVPACAFISLKEISRPALVFASLSILLLSGISLARDRYFQDYETFLEQWMKSDPTLSQPYLSMGDLLREKDELSAAEPYYLKALELDPDSVVTLNNIGTLYQALNQHEKALPHLEAVVRAHGPDLEAWHNLATSYASLGQTNRAVDTYLQVIEKGSSHAPSFFNLGFILSRTQRIPEAVNYFERAIAADPRYEPPYYSLGHLYARAGDLKTAEDLFARLLEINPAHADAQHAIAVVYARQNRLDLAIPHCREALRLNPAFVEARRNLEQMLKGQP
jgi:tetratricopeptide (TPR) repeat protein